MKIAALESSGMVASAAIAEDDHLIAEFTIDYKKTHSQTLLLMLESVFAMAGLSVRDMDAIAVSKGPGSFTGLRIGSATAKGLCLALDIPLIEVPTLDALAFNLCASDGIVCPIMDARRSQVYTCAYHMENFRPVSLIEPGAFPIDALIDKLNTFGEKVTFLGDGVPVYQAICAEKLRAKAFFAPAHVSRQKASSVALLGLMLAHEGKMISADRHSPDYFRLSQAEREKAEREKAAKEKAGEKAGTQNPEPEKSGTGQEGDRL